MRSGEARARYGALPAVALAWGVATAGPAAAPSASGATPVRVATTPPIAPPIAPRSGSTGEPRAGNAAPRMPFSPLAPLAPFGPWRRQMPDKSGTPVPVAPGPGPIARVPVAPGQGPAGNLPPRETSGKREPAPVRVPITPPVTPTVRLVHLPSSIVLRALDGGQAAFRACWVRAHRDNATPSSGKIQLHVEVDAAGKVTLAHSDTDAPTLDRCLCNVASHLAFPGRGQPASAELSLLFPVTP